MGNPDDLEGGRRLARQYLDDYAYDKIWAGLSRKDREVLCGIARTPNGCIGDIRALLGMSTNEFDPYRQRLIR